MDWKKEWEKKKVFVKLKTGAVYTGTIVGVDDSDKNIIFITLIDKFNLKVTFVVSEILKIKEEA